MLKLIPDDEYYNSYNLFSFKFEQIENNYSDISKQSKAEDELIKKKKNKSEKLNFVFSKEEIIR